MNGYCKEEWEEWCVEKAAQVEELEQKVAKCTKTIKFFNGAAKNTHKVTGTCLDHAGSKRQLDFRAGELQRELEELKKKLEDAKYHEAYATRICKCWADVWVTALRYGMTPKDADEMIYELMEEEYAIHGANWKEC